MLSILSNPHKVVFRVIVFALEIVAVLPVLLSLTFPMPVISANWKLTLSRSLASISLYSLLFNTILIKWFPNTSAPASIIFIISVHKGLGLSANFELTKALILLGSVILLPLSKYPLGFDLPSEFVANPFVSMYALFFSNRVKSFFFDWNNSCMSFDGTSLKFFGVCSFLKSTSFISCSNIIDLFLWVPSPITASLTMPAK